LTNLSEIVPVQPDGGAIWTDCIRIYTDAFPPWEREWDQVLEKRIASDRYQMRAGLKDGQVVGFYILDVEEEGQKYALFSYLAVDERLRGRGYGEELTRHAIRLFSEFGRRDWFLIEAEDRQARFYGRIGFLKLGIDYFVPRYDGSGAEPMSLMAIPLRGPAKSIDGGEMKQIVERIYRSGYKLQADDPRLERQLSLIPAEVLLIAWPPEAQPGK